MALLTPATIPPVGGRPHDAPTLTRVEPSLVPAVIVGLVIVAFGVVVLVALATERPDPAEAVVAYEGAWDRLDFELIWRLSAPELREGRSAREFVAAKRALYEARSHLAGLVDRVVVEQLDTAGRRARAITRLELRGGGEFRNEIRLRREGGRWLVDGYRLGPRRQEGVGA